MLIYLGLSSLAVFCGALAFLWFGKLTFLAATHLVLTVAILPLIFGAIAHFVPVLTRTGEVPRSVRIMPLLLQCAGFLVVLYFSGEAGNNAQLAAVVVALLVAVLFSLWLISRARNTLGKPHPCWRWYLSAVFCLVLGLSMIPAMLLWPAYRNEFRLLHLHMNTLGFIGLTALGTLQVLLPTVLSGPDPEATIRLQRDMSPALIGVLLAAIGAVLWSQLSLFGVSLLFYVAGRCGLSWLKRYGLQNLIQDGASVALASALFGFLMMLVLGAAHAVDWGVARDAVPAFIAAFLLPLVTGALSQLVPVWCYPGRRTSTRDRMRTILVWGGAVRAVFFVTSGLLLALGFRDALWLAAVGLGLFLYVLIRAFLFNKNTYP